MNYVYDTAILSISWPQRGLANTELPSNPPIATPEGREFILSKRFLQWLHPDRTTTTLYTSSLRPQESDITIINVAGHETPFLLLPHGVLPPIPDMPVDPLLTVVSLSVRRALVPAASAFAPPPSQLSPQLSHTHAYAPQQAWAPSAFQISPLQGPNTWVMPHPPYAYAPPPYLPPPAHPHALTPGAPHAPPALTSTAANIAKNRRSGRPSLPYRPPPSVFDAFDLVVQKYTHLMGHRKRYSAEYPRPCITEYDVMKVRARRTVDAMASFPWALAAASVGLVLAVVF